MNIRAGNSTLHVSAGKECEVILDIGYYGSIDSWVVDVRNLYANPYRERAIRAKTYDEAYRLGMRAAKKILEASKRRKKSPAS